MKYLFILFTFISVFACIYMPMKSSFNASESSGTLYTIAKGSHRSNKLSWQKHQIKRLDFKFTFDSTAIYKTHNEVNQGDINKLYGLSDNDFHHRNSARFGWRWYNDQLEIWAYCYNNGKRVYQKIGEASLNQPHQAALKFNKNKYIFQLNDTTVEMERSSVEPIATGYKLLPYFGGNEKAPHKITIRIEEIVSM